MERRIASRTTTTISVAQAHRRLVVPVYLREALERLHGLLPTAIMHKVVRMVVQELMVVLGEMEVNPGRTADDVTPNLANVALAVMRLQKGCCTDSVTRMALKRPDWLCE